MAFDTVLLEILGKKVLAATEEMGYTLQRTGRTLFVKETADFATALIGVDGYFFAYPLAIGVSNYIGLDCMPTIRAVPDLEEGDVVITNHPYLSGGMASHLPDLHMIEPYFHEGRIVGYGWCFIHSTDVGGYVPSSILPTNTEVFQEGLLIPPTKIVKRGRLNEELLAIMMSNCRTPDDNRGDMQAMLASLHVGRRRVAEMVAQYGAETFVDAQEAILAYAGQKARNVLRKIPDGSYEFWDYLDNDANTDVPVRIRVRIGVDDGLVHLDYSGTDPQVAAAFNVPTTGKCHPWLSLRLINLIATHDPTVDLNAGLYRNFSVTLQKGSILDPIHPAAVGVRHATAERLIEVLAGALLKAGDTLLPVANGGATTPVVFVEPDPATGEKSVLVIEPVGGGSGAQHGQDGLDGRNIGLANLSNNPIEMLEASADIVVHQYALRPDSGGAGTWRGGTGLILSFEVCRDGCQMLARGVERLKFQPWGYKGGKHGESFTIDVFRTDGRHESVQVVTVIRLDKGDRVRICTPGGGGYGDPLERQTDAVVLDVRRGLLSAERARADYGVVITDGRLDEAATEADRRRRRSPAPGAPFDFGLRREAWEAIFPDEIVCDINRRLFALPLSLRQERRRAVYEAIIPRICDETGTFAKRDERETADIKLTLNQLIAEKLAWPPVQTPAAAAPSPNNV